MADSVIPRERSPISLSSQHVDYVAVRHERHFRVFIQL